MGLFSTIGFQNLGFVLFVGWDSGFHSKMGARFKIESVHRMQDAESFHQDYRISSKNLGWDDRTGEPYGDPL